MLPDIHEKIPKVKTIMADVPAAKPSTPSVKFAPFDTAEIIKIIIGIKINQAYSLEPVSQLTNLE